MPLMFKRAYETWKAADAEARAAEARLRDAWDQFERTRTGAPTPEMIAEVTRLRAVANTRLSEVVLAMKGTTAAAKVN